MNLNLKKRELRHRVALEKAQGTAPSAGVGRLLLLSATKLEAGGRLVGGGTCTLGVGAAEPSPGSRPSAYPCVLKQEGLCSSHLNIPRPSQIQGQPEVWGAEARETQKKGECSPAPRGFSH